MTIALNSEIVRLYCRFRDAGIGHIVGEYAAGCLRAAKTYYQFRVLEAAGKVRIAAEPEEDNYFDVYGEPDTKQEREAIVAALEQHGCWHVYTEVKCHCCGNWERADSIGMCVYSNPTSPFENDYVIDLMRRAIDLHEELLNT